MELINKQMDTTKHIWEGWTVGAFIDELEPTFRLIISNQSHIKPFTTKQEVKEWCMSNQPYYKKYIPEVTKYFIKLAKL